VQHPSDPDPPEDRAPTAVHKAPRHLTLAWLFAIGAATTACAPSGDADALRDVPEPLAALPAPPGASFATVHTVRLHLDIPDHEPPGRLVHLKVTAPGLGQVLLGRVDPQRVAEPVFSLPRALEMVTYELYDETGWRVTRTATLEVVED
jgi:hypothetical protein